MENLHHQFEAVLRSLGLTGTLSGALLEKAPAFMRFAAGGGEKIYLADHRKPNGAYVENALDRALTLFDSLPGTPDLLRIDFEQYAGAPSLPGSGELRRIRLPAPQQIVSALSRSDGSGTQSLYWSVPPKPDFLRPLFREIIRSELSSEGLEWLCGSVYFADTANSVLFHLYDDRGACLAAPGKTLLLPLYRNFRDWISEEDLPGTDAAYRLLL